MCIYICIYVYIYIIYIYIHLFIYGWQAFDDTLFLVSFKTQFFVLFTCVLYGFMHLQENFIDSIITEN